MVTGTSSVPTQPTAVVMGPGTSVENGAATPRRTTDNRRSNKPIMEKRRRARINNCLNELKTLILDAMKKDPARHSKLEKADILEMTVKHLQNLQRQQAAMSSASDPSVLGKFRAGFSECAGEVGRFPGLDPTVKRRLLSHLANCLNQPPKPQQDQISNGQIQVHILPAAASETVAATSSPNGIVFSNANGTSLQLVPTRLPNGDIALVLPASASGGGSPLPLLVPIPTRTSSNASASSSTSNCSSLNSPEPMEMGQGYGGASMPKPLSLVVKKSHEEKAAEETELWRPW